MQSTLNIFKPYFKYVCNWIDVGLNLTFQCITPHLILNPRWQSQRCHSTRPHVYKTFINWARPSSTRRFYCYKAHCYETPVRQSRCPKKNVPCQTLVNDYIGRGAVLKLSLPNENLPSHRLCPKISNENVVIIIFR